MPRPGIRQPGNLDVTKAPAQGDVPVWDATDKAWAPTAQASLAGSGGTPTALSGTGGTVDADAALVQQSLGGILITPAANKLMKIALPSVPGKNVFEINAAGSGLLRFFESDGGMTNGGVLLSGYNNAALSIRDDDHVYLTLGAGNSVIEGDHDGNIAIFPDSGKKLCFFGAAGGGAVQGVSASITDFASLKTFLQSLGMIGA